MLLLGRSSTDCVDGTCKSSTNICRCRFVKSLPLFTLVAMEISIDIKSSYSKVKDVMLHNYQKFGKKTKQ